MKGNVIVVGDLHGDYEDYIAVKDKWDQDNPDSHFILLGDYIDGYDPNRDGSLNILDDIRFEMTKDNFHALGGNHELAHIRNEQIFRNNRPLANLLMNQIRGRYVGKLQPYYDNYKNLFKEMSRYEIIGDIWFSHAGPSNNPIKNKSVDITEFMWNRPMYDYNEEDVDNFLESRGLKHMIVGHEHLPYWSKFGKQYLIASHSNSPRFYMDIDLSDTDDLDKYIYKL